MPLMNDKPIYKSLKVTLETWQAATRVTALTGEPRTKLVERLIKAEEQRLTRTK